MFNYYFIQRKCSAAEKNERFLIQKHLLLFNIHKSTPRMIRHSVKKNKPLGKSMTWNKTGKEEKQKIEF